MYQIDPHSTNMEEALLPQCSLHVETIFQYISSFLNMLLFNVYASPCPGLKDCQCHLQVKKQHGKESKHQCRLHR